ncbi:hypothetical protein RCJ22_10195 [Vibrio sp. FNV 38]|nr:hypothetical protein [Vibrio sp. FNV 38]
MKMIKLGLLAAALSVSGYALADNDTAINLMALKTSNTSIEALTPTVRSAHQGVVTEIELDDYKDMHVIYEFKLVDLEGDIKHKLSYSVQDQSLLREKSESLSTFGFSDLDKEDRMAIERVLQADFDILQAVPALEKKYNSTLIEAELEEKNGLVFYEVKLASAEQGKQELLINVENGEEIPVLKRNKK